MKTTLYLIRYLHRALAEEDHIDEEDHDGEDENHDDHADEEENNSMDALIAFLIVLLAGLSTAIGSSVVFFPKLVKLASPRVLASGLGIAAGVMVFLSLVEIFPIAVNHFMLAGNEHGVAFAFASCAFFGGMAIMMLLNRIVHCLMPKQHAHEHHCGDDFSHKGEGDQLVEVCEDNLCNEPAITPPHCMSCTDNPLGELSKWKANAEAEVRRNSKDTSTTHSSDNDTSHSYNDVVPIKDLSVAELESASEDDIVVHSEEGVVGVLDTSLRSTGNFKSNGHSHCHSDEKSHDGSHEHSHDHHGHHDTQNSISKDHDHDNGHHHQHNHDGVHDARKLFRTGITSAIAIALHNFPEGLATFIASVENPEIGLVLALAIALHNIPEGLCVSLPVYYSTGSRCKGFLFGVLSGVSEPIAALIGWGILRSSDFSDTMYAVLFGITAGMMVMIALKELLPTAHRYDPQDTVVTTSLIVGLFIIGLSLVLFEVLGNPAHDHGHGGSHAGHSDEHFDDHDDHDGDHFDDHDDHDGDHFDGHDDHDGDHFNDHDGDHFNDHDGDNFDDHDDHDGDHLDDHDGDGDHLDDHDGERFLF